MNIPIDYQPPHPRLSGTDLEGRDEKTYLAHPDLLAAANAALAVQQPLLLTGEPGCGKTDFAYAAASGLRDDPHAGPDTGKLLECYVRSDSLARDLLYHYDALSRFDAARHGGEIGRRRAQDARSFVDLRPLGRALMSPYLRVVLIDEIDKAPRDLPNDLLRELDQGHFDIPEIADDRDARAEARAGTVTGTGVAARKDPVDGKDWTTYRRHMVRPNRDQKPLVIITSNVERQLPDPFLRRCVFFHIPFPDEAQLRSILIEHVPDASELFVDRVLHIFMMLRDGPSLTKKPATSELLGWARALRTVYEPGAVQEALDRFVRAPDRKPWLDLPALGCLIKLREDLDRLEPGF